MPMTDVITWDGENMTAKRVAALLAATTAVATISACTSAGSRNAALSAPTTSTSSVATDSSPASDTSNSAPATTSTPSASPSPASFTADYSKYVAAAWLTQAQLPFTATFSWKSDGKAPVGAKGWIQQDWYSCGADWGYDPDKDAVQTVNYTAPSNKPQAQLAEQLIFFTDPQAASHALDQIAAAYTACATTTSMPGNGPEGTETVSLQKTASIDGGFAYLHTARKPDGSVGTGVMHWGTDAHEYFVRRGNVLALITLYAVNAAGGKGIDVTTSDSAVLQETAGHLTTAYAKG
jgi:hypothetical protein